MLYTGHHTQNISSAPPCLGIWYCSWILLIGTCHQELVPASPLLPTFCCLGAGMDGLPGEAEAPSSFCMELAAWGWFSSLNWCLMVSGCRSSENTYAVFLWCPNDWFHTSVQETVTESCWIMAHQRSVCSESIQGLPGSQQGWLMNIAVNDLVLPVFTGGTSGCGRLPVCPWTQDSTVTTHC